MRESQLVGVLLKTLYCIIRPFTFHSIRCGEAVGDECVIPSGKASPNREARVWWSSRPQGALFTLLGLAGPLLPVPIPLSSPSALALSLTRSSGSTRPSEGRVIQLWYRSSGLLWLWCLLVKYGLDSALPPPGLSGAPAAVIMNEG